MCILAIGAHADDVEIGCGGTIRSLVEAGEEVHILVMTDGRGGSLRANTNELVKVRQLEARNAAEKLGTSSVTFFGLQDGFTQYTREEKLRLVAFIRKFKPKQVFVHGYCEKFGDHALVRELVLSALSVSGGPWFSEIEVAPHKVERIFGYEVWNPINNPQRIVDVSATMDVKLEALTQHRSQIDCTDYLGAVKGLGAYRGIMSGVGTYAEAFEVIRS